MNRNRQQIKAAKARKEWQRLQEELLLEKKKSKTPTLKKIRRSKKRDVLRDTA